MMIRKPKYRSEAFHAYLERQTPERRAELIAAETAAQLADQNREQVEERVFAETMSGYAETPAGGWNRTPLDITPAD
jgi:hypothetical protein